MSVHHPRHDQRGATLIVALIMLVTLAMLGVWAVNSSTTNLRSVGNMQARDEALAAAVAAVEQTISTPLFTKEPAAVAASPIPVDVDGDGNSDYTVTLTPPPNCYRMRTLKSLELEPDSAADRVCLGTSSSPNSGIEIVGAAPPTGDSLCADSDLNVRAEVVDPRSSARVAVNQGISVRTLTTDAIAICP